MTQMMRSLGHNQFEWAKWAKDAPDTCEFIRVSVVSEEAKRFSTVFSNVVTQANSTMLLTSYAKPYAVRQHIFYRGKWWEITAVGEKTQDVNPQTLGLVRADVNTQHILEIIEADWGDDKTTVHEDSGPSL